MGDQLLRQVGVTGVRNLLPEHVSPHSGRGIVGADVRLDDAIGEITDPNTTGVLAKGISVESDCHGLTDLEVRDLLHVDPQVQGVDVVGAEGAPSELVVRRLLVLEHSWEVLRGHALAHDRGHVKARTCDHPLVDDLRVDPEVDLPLVWIRVAICVARLGPLVISDQDHLAAIAGLVARDLVRARGDWKSVGGPVRLTGIGHLGDRNPPQCQGIGEVRNGMVQMEGDRLPVRGAVDRLVEEGLLGRSGLVRARVLRGLAVRLVRNVEVRDRVGRTAGDDVGRERSRGAVLDVRARDRRAVLEGDTIAEGEDPGLGAVT